MENETGNQIYNPASKLNIVVLKFGGSTLGKAKDADKARFDRLVRIVKYHLENGFQPIVVISAFAGETKRLSDEFELFDPLPPEVKDPIFRKQLKKLAPLKQRYLKELANVITIGEVQAAGTFSYYLMSQGIRSRSFQAWQIPIITTDNFYDAEIIEIGKKELSGAIRAGLVPVVCGFQGITVDMLNTMLGFNGSDYTASAIAAAFGCPVILYKDVDGIYTGDPKTMREAKRLSVVSYEQMEELAKDNDSSPVHTKAIGAAKKAGIPIEVRGLDDFDDPGKCSVIK
jgi:aspartate kinase